MAQKRIILIGDTELTQRQKAQLRKEGFTIEEPPLFAGRAKSAAAIRQIIQNCFVNLPEGPLPLYNPQDTIVIQIGYTHTRLKPHIIKWVQDNKEFTPGYLEIGRNGSITVVSSTKARLS